MSNLSDKAHFLLQMVCAEFTAHGLNNSLKIYSVDKSEPISTLRFLQPFQFSCLMAGQ